MQAHCGYPYNDYAKDCRLTRVDSAYRSTRTVNQNLLSALNISLSKKTQCLKPLNRNGGGFLIGHIGVEELPVVRILCIQLLAFVQLLAFIQSLS